ncbi:MAG: alpha/beta hydrolase [Saprospiraceae bacterium]|nr:alpha/beta hydrolase [Saprospiraceae bacterium]
MPFTCKTIPANINYQVNPLNLNVGPQFPRYAVLKNRCYTSWDGLPIQYDIVIPESASHVPLVIFIHGGGFLTGSKVHGFGTKYKPAIKALLKNEIAYASINYRLMGKNNEGAAETETLGIKKPLFDCVAALQNFRSNAAVLKLDYDRMAFLGGSGGAGTALWIALQGDMQDTAATDFKKESTKVKAVVAFETQSSYDKRIWANQLFNIAPNYFSLKCIKNIIETPRFRQYYYDASTPPLNNVSAIETAIQNYLINNLDYKGSQFLNLDMLNMVSPDSPPIWLESTKEVEDFPNNNCVPTNREQMVHHPYHPNAVLQKLKLFPTLNYVARINALGIFEQNDPIDYTMKTYIQFLIDKLQ